MSLVVMRESVFDGVTLCEGMKKHGKVSWNEIRRRDVQLRVGVSLQKTSCTFHNNTYHSSLVKNCRSSGASWYVDNTLV